MTRTENIEKIRAACIKANPSIKPTTASVGCPNCHDHDGAKITVKLDRRIRLADVLLAINYSMFVGPQGRFWRWTHMDETPLETAFWWNLRAGSLEEQSDETISFLAELV